MANRPEDRVDAHGWCICCFHLHQKHDRICATVAGPKGRCTGTATIPLPGGLEITLHIDKSLDEIADLLGTPGEITEDCKSCSSKCLPLPLLVIIPVEKDITYSGTYEKDVPIIGHISIPYTTTLHCKIEGTWLILWTCCKAA